MLPTIYPRLNWPNANRAVSTKLKFDAVSKRKLVSISRKFAPTQWKCPRFSSDVLFKTFWNWFFFKIHLQYMNGSDVSLFDPICSENNESASLANTVQACKMANIGCKLASAWGARSAATRQLQSIIRVEFACWDNEWCLAEGSRVKDKTVNCNWWLSLKWNAQGVMSTKGTLEYGC